MSDFVASVESADVEQKDLDIRNADNEWFGYGCALEPKAKWIPSKFIQAVAKMKESPDMPDSQVYALQVGDFGRKYSKRHLLRNKGVHFDSPSLVVSGAGLNAVNGLYHLDRGRCWRGAPVWHHERGACDAQWDGRGGGATILFDVLPQKVNGANADTSYTIFYNGAPRYMNLPGDALWCCPSARWRTWKAENRHEWNGVDNLQIDPAPTTHAAEWNEGMQTVLQAEAEAEAGCDPSNGDIWVVDTRENGEGRFKNWVFKPWISKEKASTARPYKITLLRDGQRVLKKIKYVGQEREEGLLGSFGLATTLVVAGYTDDGKTVVFRISLIKDEALDRIRELIEISESYSSDFMSGVRKPVASASLLEAMSAGLTPSESQLRDMMRNAAAENQVLEREMAELDKMGAGSDDDVDDERGVKRVAEKEDAISSMIERQMRLQDQQSAPDEAADVGSGDEDGEEETPEMTMEESMARAAAIAAELGIAMPPMMPFQ